MVKLTGCLYFDMFLGIKRRSKVPGVMITQYAEELPEGKSTPDFTRKPIALTIQEGKQIDKVSYKTQYKSAKCENIKQNHNILTFIISSH